MIADVNLQREPRLSGLGRVVKPALAGLLAFLLLISATLAVSGALHQLLHHDADGGHHLCLICLFAKGQVSAADVALVATLLVLCPLFSFRTVNLLPLSAFDYRLSPSRATPAS